MRRSRALAEVRPLRYLGLLVLVARVDERYNASRRSVSGRSLLSVRQLQDLKGFRATSTDF
jgi:hypothetical protein